MSKERMRIHSNGNVSFNSTEPISQQEKEEFAVKQAEFDCMNIGYPDIKEMALTISKKTSLATFRFAESKLKEIIEEANDRNEFLTTTIWEHKKTIKELQQQLEAKDKKIEYWKSKFNSSAETVSECVKELNIKDKEMVEFAEWCLKNIEDYRLEKFLMDGAISVTTKQLLTKFREKA